MRRFFLTLFLLCAGFYSVYAQYKKTEALFGTNLTYELPNSKGYPFTGHILQCKGDNGYYIATRYSLAEDSKEEDYLVFQIGEEDEAIKSLNTLMQLILNSTADFSARISDASGTEFILMAPKDGERIGSYLILQKEGENDWGIITKFHLKIAFKKLEDPQ